MKIRRVIIKGLRNFTDFDGNFIDSWNGEVPDALLFIGINGSGKTTLLNTIAGLWLELSHILKGEFPDENNGDGVTLYPLTDFKYAHLAAMEISGFMEQEPFWVYIGSDQNEISAFIKTHLHSLRFGRVSLDMSYRIHLPGEKSGVQINLVGEDKLPFWLLKWMESYKLNVLGAEHNLANMIYLESENRVLLPLAKDMEITPESQEYRWLARYQPSNSRKGSLQNYLFTLKAVDPERYEEILAQINGFLDKKKITGFDRRSRELIVQVGDQTHSINDLSSGEKQVIMMLVHISRWLERGGIVLIDEPDLHLHVSLLNGFIQHLRRMVAEKNGQLILASHAPELWRSFTDAELVRLGALPVQEVNG